MRAAVTAAGGYAAADIAAAPDDETFARVMLGINSLNNVRSESLWVFPRAECRRIVAGLA